MGYRRQRLLIIKSGEGGGAITEDAFASVAGAALNTGVGKTTDTLDLVALNDTTLRIMPAQEMFFVENFADGIPITEAMVSFPQLDYPLANLGLTVDGTYLRYIGYDVDGVVQVGTANFFMNQSVAHLGFVLVKVVGGVTTFLDGAAGPRNVSSSPMMASSSLLERAYATTQSNVSVIPNVGAMTFAKSAGVIRGPSINWHGGANIHELVIAGQTPASFTRINPGSAAQPVLPVASTLFNAGTYWNGVASVAVPNPNNATVQRWLVGFKGGLWLQEGETVYTNLADAVDGIYNAKFSTVYPSDTYAEVARTAAIRSTTDVNNNAQSVTVQTGHVGGSGSGAAGSGPVFAEALLGVTIAPNVVNASLNNLTPFGGLLTITGDLAVSGTINTSKSGVYFAHNAVTTDAVYTSTSNNGNSVRFGVENSVGGNQLPGSLAYDGFISTASHGLSLGAFSTNILRLSSTGAEVLTGLNLKTGGGRVLSAVLQAGTPNVLDQTIHYFFSSAPGAAVVNLPSLATNLGREYWIKNVGGSTLTVAPNGADQLYLSSGVSSMVLNPGQWLHIIGGNAYWAEVGSSSGSGILILPASTTAFASMRVPHGVAPAAPVNGDIWTTTTGAFIQINGTTVQFGSTGTGGTDASTLTGATLASNIINASLENITPASGLLTIGGHIKAYSFTATTGVAPLLASTTVVDYPTTYARLMGVGANPTTQGNIWLTVASSDATQYTPVAHITSGGIDITGYLTTSQNISIYNLTPKLQLFGTGNADAAVVFQASTGQFNWKIATVTNVVNALEFIPSNAAGGSTYSSTPTLYMRPGQVFANGVIGAHGVYPLGNANAIGAMLNQMPGTETWGLDARRWTGAATEHDVAYVGQYNNAGTYPIGFFYDAAKTTNTQATTLRAMIDQGAFRIFSQVSVIPPADYQGLNVQRGTRNAGFSMGPNANEGPFMFLNNSTPTTGKSWHLRSYDGGYLVFFDASTGTEQVIVSNLGLQVQGRISANINQADIAVANFSNTNANGYGTATVGGGTAGRYIFIAQDYAATTKLLLTEVGMQLTNNLSIGGVPHGPNSMLTIRHNHGTQDGIEIADTNAAPFDHWVIGLGAGDGVNGLGFYNRTTAAKIFGLFRTGVTVGGATFTVGSNVTLVSGIITTSAGVPLQLRASTNTSVTIGVDGGNQLVVAGYSPVAISTGLNVTGAITATGSITLANSASFSSLNSTGTGSPLIFMYNDNNVYRDSSGGGGHIFDRVNGTTRGDWSAGGLAVTGDVSFTGSSLSTNANPYFGTIQNTVGVMRVGSFGTGATNIAMVVGNSNIGTFSPTGLQVNPGFVIGNVSGSGYGALDSGGTPRRMLWMYSDNNVYLDSSVGGGFIYIRPGSATFSFSINGLVGQGDIVQTGAYHNFSGVQGSTGFGIRHNGGVMEFKHNGGSWTAIGGGGGGGSVTSIAINGANGITSSGGPITTNGTFTLGLGDITPTSVDVSTIYKVQGVQVLTTRRSAIATQTITAGGFTSSDAGVLTANFTAINGMLQPVLVALRAHGLIAP